MARGGWRWPTNCRGLIQCILVPADRLAGQRPGLGQPGRFIAYEIWCQPRGPLGYVSWGFLPDICCDKTTQRTIARTVFSGLLEHSKLPVEKGQSTVRSQNRKSEMPRQSTLVNPSVGRREIGLPARDEKASEVRQQVRRCARRIECRPTQSLTRQTSSF